MAYWRMKLRAVTHGQDMWPLCKEKGVAAISYDGVEKIDLATYTRKNHPPGWNLKGAAPGSMGSFAWEIRGGDVIYVADSVSQEIVGMGLCPKRKSETSPIGSMRDSPIVSQTTRRGGKGGDHLIDVDWDQAFAPFPYEHPRARKIHVLKLNQAEIQIFERATEETEHRQRGLTEEEVQNALLLETAYSRYTPAALRADSPRARGSL